MPSRILNFGRPRFSPAASDNSVDEALTRKSPTAEHKPTYPGMDLFHHAKEKRHSLTGGGRVSPAPKNSPKNSPRIGPVKSAKLEFDVESPPLVVYGTPSTSSGALFSGQLLLTVLDPEIELKTFEMSLIATVTTKKPVSKDCPNCATKTNELKKWVYLTEPTRLPKGVHNFPSSYLLPGHLPATCHGVLGVIDYYLSAKATTALDTISVTRYLTVQRALMPGPDKQSLRIFPPTNLTTNVQLPPVIHPIGEFPVLMRINGVADQGKDYSTRWRLRKMNWRINEYSKIISEPCAKHAHKVGGEGKGILHEDTRDIGGEDVKGGWKTDFDSPGGNIEFEFQASIRPGCHPLCDVESSTGLAVTHALAIELIVAEEHIQKGHRLATPTGAARVLRMVFKLILTERSGLGISWDEEQPPTYEDVPLSPPGYPKIDDYDGEPLPYEELDHMRH